jgi:hypothetical protein
VVRFYGTVTYPCRVREVTVNGLKIIKKIENSCNNDMAYHKENRATKGDMGRT